MLATRSILRYQRTAQRRASTTPLGEIKKRYDAIIVGGGHNGLTAAAYLAKAGKSVCVLERRHVLGGAAVTEEIIPGFKFSRASYLLSLFRPEIINDLKLMDRGLKYHLRNPNSFTPVINSKKSLLLGLDMAANQKEIANFSPADAEAYPRYEHMMEAIVRGIAPLMDQQPFRTDQTRFKLLRNALRLYDTVRPMGLENVMPFYELMTAPISKVMDKWFEGDVLKATLATDGVIGFAAGPRSAGTGYVLLHHVLGELNGRSGAWAYVYGGMGAVSDAIADAAVEYGAKLFVDAEVAEILVDGGNAMGIKLKNGNEIHANIVLSNATPKVTFEDLLNKADLPKPFMRAIRAIDYTSPVTKINVAVKELPDFPCRPNTTNSNKPMPHHQTTIHLNCESVDILQNAYTDYQNGQWSKRPAIEMTIPSSVDRTIVPEGGGHVILLFTQYTPYNLKDREWNDETRKEYATLVFNQIDEYAPNFSRSIVGYEVLTPPDLEKAFNLTGGNIFHGSMSLDQLYWNRPIAGNANYTTPIKGLFLCGSGTHPGGGVTGAPGRLAARVVLDSQ